MKPKGASQNPTSKVTKITKFIDDGKISILSGIISGKVGPI
jgi:hypothetical protein